MKLIDNYVLDTTRTLNLIILTGITSISGLGVYLTFSYILKIEELSRFTRLIDRFGAWREVLGRSREVLDSSEASS